MRCEKNLVLLISCLSVLTFSACEKGQIERKKTENNKSEETLVKAPEYDNSLPGEEGMKNCIRGYSQAVIDAKLSDVHIKFIRKFATEKESKRVLIFINEDREKKQAMVTRLNKLVFDNISTSEDTNFVDTSEHWDFQRIYIANSEPAEAVRSMSYKLRYHFVKEDGRWVVSKIKQLEDAKIGDYTPPRWKM